jgi:hypothetical protein
MKLFVHLLILYFFSFAQNECKDWQKLHPEWIFCDDFEDTASLVKVGRYFEYDNNNGDFIVLENVGINNSRGMRAKWQVGEVNAGSIKLAFGRNPNSYMNKQNIHTLDTFREIYYRMYLRMQKGWQGSPAKLSRATVFTSSSDWRQAMIAHLWSDDKEHLLIDPASCVDPSGKVVCTTYNDFVHLKWLGNKSGITPIFSSENSGKWFCIEHHVKLNDPGQSNGIQEFWIDGNLEARREGLNFVGTYTEYAINAIFFENYWNSGSPIEQERYFDNIVISEKPIGCLQTEVINRDYNIINERFYNNHLKINIIYKSNQKYLIVNADKINNYKIQIFNSNGKKINNIVSNDKKLYKLNEIPSGIYFITVLLENNVFIKKVFII